MDCEKVGQSASEYFSQGYLCSEAVLMAVAKAAQIDSPLIPSIATAFGSGLARTDGTCGALSGGIMALSLFGGRSTPSETYDKLYANVALLKDKFHQQFASHECSTLLGFSLSDSDAKEKFAAGDCRQCKCTHYVAFAAQEVCRIVS